MKTVRTILQSDTEGCAVQSLFVLHAKGMRDVVKNPQEYYAVHLAAAAGFRDGLLYILKNMGADIDARSGQGATPLMLAVENGHLDVASALLARGARVGRPAVSLGEETGARAPVMMTETNSFHAHYNSRTF